MLEIVFRLVYFGPQEIRTADAEGPWQLQFPEELVPRNEERERLSPTEVKRLPYTSRLDRLYRISDYQIYGDLEPNRDVLVLAESDYPYRMVTNASGLRRKEQLTEKQPGTVRVLCIGDSFTFGPYVSNQDTFPSIAEELLNHSQSNHKFEILNAGVVGYFLRRQKDLYISQARGVEPDIVVLQVLDNDLSGYIKSGYVESEFPTPEAEKHSRPPSMELVREKSQTLKYRSISVVKSHSDSVGLFFFATHLIDWVYRKRIGVVQASGTSNQGNYASPTQKRDPIALDLWINPAQADLLSKSKAENEKDFRELVEAVAKDGAKLMVLYIPTQKTLAMHDAGHDPVDEYYRGLARRYNVDYLSLLGKFAADGKRFSLFLWPWNLHLSRFGYYAVAEELTGKLIQVTNLE